MKRIPERTFRHLLRLADTLSKPEARVELRAELYRIWREQQPKRGTGTTDVTILTDEFTLE